MEGQNSNTMEAYGDHVLIKTNIQKAEKQQKPNISHAALCGVSFQCPEDS